MIARERVREIAEAYDASKIHVACIGSHSALDVCDGAADEGLPSIAVCQAGREKTYAEYFRTEKGGKDGTERGFVDDAWVLSKFSDVLTPSVQTRLRKRNAVFVPNRSFTSYCDVGKIEDGFEVPIFGTRSMLRTEERSEERDYYWLLEKAGLPYPERVKDPTDIDALVIVKLHHAKKKLERGFFTAASYAEYKKKSAALLKQGVIDKESLARARIEKYVIGPVFNFDFFYSPMERPSPLELLGVDSRFESSLDGHVRLPAAQQLSLGPSQTVPEYTVVGHNSATLRESLLEDVFALAEKFVRATKAHYKPGIIGPFCLQTCVDADMGFYIYDVAPRIGGGTNVHVGVGHPYGNSLWRKPMSTGRRIAMEIRRAAEAGRLAEVVT
ncbi:MAG: formate--phosphoribosylaminoimidazolecarboxamide ligase family protein [Methanobacteriota archaeon]